jgi:CBS domain-containing protein
MPAIERHVTRELVSVDARATCREAARLMEQERIGAVVVREAGQVIGLLTERDLAVRVIARGLDGEAAVSQVMRRDLPATTPRASETEVSAAMKECATRHLLVKDGTQVVGIISMRDVIQLMLDDKQFLIEQLQTYIEGR